MSTRETLSRLRDVLARELETISIYEAHAEAETDPEMKTLFQHLADEEKEHVTEVYEALLGRDAAQKKWAESGLHAQAIREGRFSEATAGSPSQGVATSSPSGPTAPAPAVAAASAAIRSSPAPQAVISSLRTVGSLHGQPGPTAGDSVVAQPPAATPIVPPVVKPLVPGDKAPGIRPTPPTIGSLLGLPQI
jgi:hypothetical protein